MTEQEWLGSEDPDALLRGLLATGHSRRKVRLYVCAGARRIWHMLTDERSRQALLAGERYAEGLVSEAEREAAFQDALQVSQATQQGKPEWSAAAAAASVLIPYTQGVAGVPQHVREAVAGGRRRLSRTKSARSAAEAEQVVQLRLLRDILGNPFRPATMEPARLSPAAALSHAAYDERLLPSGDLDTARLAVLADALDEAGAGEAILSHLRSPGPHVRGCWAVDLALRKE